MSATRAVGWEGFVNTRDLGGLPTRDGGTTRWGALYRSAMLDFVTPRGWRQAYDAGVRTVVDLRNDDEVDASLPDPAGIVRRRTPLDGIEDSAFWEPFLVTGLHGTPLYYDEFLRRKSDRVAAAMTAIARAEGGVVFHCGGGRDRTGLITLMLLGLAGVEVEAICDDYLLVDENLFVLGARLRRADDRAEIAALISAHGTTAADVVRQTLAEWEPAAYLRSAGVAEADINGLRDRLVGHVVDSGR